MEKLYSDKRWWVDPGAISSQCGECKHWQGYCKCDCYDPEVPREILDKSFPGTEEYDENYCPYIEIQNDDD